MSPSGKNPSHESLLAHAEWVRMLARDLAADDNRADDLVQDTWLATLRKPPRSAQNLRSWIAKVVTNLARQKHREEVARTRRERRVSSERLAPSTDSIVERGELHKNLVNLVFALPEPNRRTLVLRYFGELSAAQIARREGVPEATIRSRIKRGLALLRRQLELQWGERKNALLSVLAGCGTQSTLSASIGGLLLVSTVAKFALISVVVGAVLLILFFLPTESEHDAKSTKDEIASSPTSMEKSEVALGSSRHIVQMPQVGTASKKPPRVFGSVISIDGDVVPGAEVVLTSKVRSGSSRLRTDEDGVFSFDVTGGSRYRIEAYGPMSGFGYVNDIAPDQEAICVVDHGGSLDVFVADKSTGLPIENAVVTAHWGMSARLQPTDGEGRVRFDGLGLDYEANVRVQAMGFHERKQRASIEKGKLSEVLFELDRGKELVGQVLDAKTRLGLGHVSVIYSIAEDVTESQLTDAVGRYRFDSVGLGGWVTCRLDGYQTTRFKVDNVPQAVCLHKGVRLVGVVIDEGGVPVEEATVTIHRDRESRQATCDAGGLFCLADLDPAKKLVLNVHADGLAPQRVGPISLDPPPLLFSIALVPSCSLRGIVTDKRGDRLPEAELFLRTPTNSLMPLDFVSRASLDDEACFEWHGLPPGAYQIYARHGGRAKSIEVELSGRRLTNLQVVLGSGGSADGIVRDELGVPLAGALVTIHRADRQQRFMHNKLGRSNAISNREGAFLIEGLVDGEPNKVRVSRTGYMTSSFDVSVGQHVVAQLTRARSITAQVLDAESRQPVAGSWVLVKEGDGEPSRHGTQSDGRVSLEVGPNSKLSASSENHQASRRISPEEGEDAVTIALNRGIRIAGSVVTQNGEKAHRVSVVMIHEEDEIDPHYTVTDTEGKFTFAQATRGRWRIVIGGFRNPCMDPISVQVREDDVALDPITLPDMAELTLLIQSSDGARVQGVAVHAWLIRARSGSVSALTDSVGHAAMELLPGRYSIQVHAKELVEFKVDLEPGARVTKTITVSEGRE